MSIFKHRIKQATVGFSLAALLAAGAAVPALADNSVYGDIDGGSLTSSIADLDLGAVNYAHTSQNMNGTMALTVDDQTGTGDGWNVTVVASDFVYSGANDGAAIAATNFSLGTIGTPAQVAGQAVDGTDGPVADAANNSASLDQARRVVYANPDFGQGQYSQDLPVTLTVPGQSRAGTYTTTLTVTATSGPGS